MIDTAKQKVYKNVDKQKNYIIPIPVTRLPDKCIKVVLPLTAEFFSLSFYTVYVMPAYIHTVYSYKCGLHFGLNLDPFII